MADTTIIRRSGQAPLRIRGTLLASEGTSKENSSGYYSGSTGRSQSVRIYRTASGKFVVAIHHSTSWQGEHDTDEAGVFPSLVECVEFLGQRVPSSLHSRLVDELGEEQVSVDVD